MNCTECGSVATEYRFETGANVEELCEECAHERAAAHVQRLREQGVLGADEGAWQARLEYLSAHEIKVGTPAK